MSVREWLGSHTRTPKNDLIFLLKVVPLSAFLCYVSYRLELSPISCMIYVTPLAAIAYLSFDYTTFLASNKIKHYLDAITETSKRGLQHIPRPLKTGFIRAYRELRREQASRDYKLDPPDDEEDLDIGSLTPLRRFVWVAPCSVSATKEVITHFE